MSSRAERFLAHLDELTGGVEPRFLKFESTKEGLKGVTVLVYEDLPDGLTTMFTYGLSLADHPDWKAGRPELCLSIASDDDSWATTLGAMVEEMRGSCPFTYTDTIGFEEPAQDSQMTAFVVFAPAVVDKEDTRVDVSPEGQEGDDIINLVGLYPIHDSERKFITEQGIGPFWDLEWDLYDVARGPAA